MDDTPLPETHRVFRLIAPSRDTHTNWLDKDPVFLEGVLGFTKDRLFNGSLEYSIGDGIHPYSELTKYGGAEASVTSKANTLVLRDENGKIDSSSINFPTVPDATPTTKGIVKASTTKAADNVVKADSNGGLDGWKEAITDAILDDNGENGLITDANGNLAVDFDQMPTTKFEALLKSLKMQIPLSANMNLYVDTNSANAADTIEDGRGTQAMPFKTIQAAVNFATQTYALGARNIYIYIAPGTYKETLSLPQFTATSGSMNLRALNEETPPTIVTPDETIGSTPIRISGGRWFLRRLNITAHWAAVNDGLIHSPSVISVSNGSTYCSLSGCAITCDFSGECTSGWHNPRVVQATDGALIDFNLLSGYHNSFNCSKGDADVLTVLYALSNSVIQFRTANTEDDGIMYVIPCTGSMTTFAYADSNSHIGHLSGGQYFQEFTGTMTGKRYNAQNFSYITGPYGGFPGDTEGTPGSSTNYVDLNTFARYAERTASTLNS